MVAAKSLAITGADLFADAQLVADAKADFKKQLDGATLSVGHSGIPEAAARLSAQVAVEFGYSISWEAPRFPGRRMKVTMSRSSMRLIGVGVPALLAASIVIASGVAQPRDKSHDKPDRQGVFLRFLNRGEPRHLENPPHLELSFGGRRLRAVMDTGSTGIVVSASAIPNIDRLPNRGPGTLTYTSSGRIERGDWVVVRATIAGANGASVTTLPIPVLAVRSVDCLDNARNCTVREDPRHVAMIGVGFGAGAIVKARMVRT